VLSPLAFSEDGRYALRFEAYVGGVELANGFCEQNDPILQRKILENQAARLGGVVDESFIQTLSCGMPSAFGVGIGIERLVMLVTGCEHIR
ncbi:amino acid--tRNA ligase-related protein, partial [Salmonella enterica]|uniref:amino acid--tRNA ligase-related protein n=1 Tax=Salmonella enterica TaxID=28901 RepID=UPI003D2CFDCD